MIIKKNLKSQMPSLKRCKLGESAGEDEDNSGRKKRKTNGYYPLNLLGEVAVVLYRSVFTVCSVQLGPRRASLLRGAPKSRAPRGGVEIEEQRVSQSED
ncbi:histone-lysine N-methyltransferase ATX5 [Prunus yedoensis var. nudiflora]|uniref:Histone-lysine N-methyltransferase ATX5 n=1 Tax=Prunus yedoensis var. nudiflora TaxID=2094558 RepID=A0A314XFW7_PRUYE|nr:histone-lysine N-methyltransferase ATX5 [Prunus yedoensis var. nudiflora]